MATTTDSPRSSSEQQSSSVFDRLHEGVRRWIWDQNWTALRPIQERAAVPILEGSSDVIISAPTAGGKTEAAFLPIASRLAEAQLQSIGCLCVSPLKALINDQADRLTPLFERVALPLTPWHGDVPHGRKRALLRDRAGVLLITPESLEAFFVLRGSQVSALLGTLQYVVVDELHSFIGTERGRQLQSLLHRVELAIRRRVPRIALSATLGDMGLAAEALRPGHGTGVVLVKGERDGRELRMQLRGYKERRPVVESEPGPDEDGAMVRLAEDLFTAVRGSDNLIFANSRGQVEELADRLRRRCEGLRLPNEFYAHHGNLAKEIREDAEDRVKDTSRPTSVVCTSTLELGVDIGSVTSIAQIGSPPSVATLRQRLGRSGREENAPAVIRIFVIEEEIEASSSLMDELRVELIQSVAIVERLLARWWEPPLDGQLHFSTLVQQILSIIAQHGGVSARDLYQVLCQSGPFRGIDGMVFARLLRSLGRGHILIQMGDGQLTLGERGERLVGHYSFYTAFVTPEEYRLVTGGKTLGCMPVSNPLAPGSFLIFAGRRWEVRSVDDEARVIELAASKGGRAPRFGGGGFNVHDEVRREMRRIYTSTSIPVYLDETARGLLSEARRFFERSGLPGQDTVERGTDLYLFPWRGDRVLHTLALKLTALKLNASVEGVAVMVRRAEPEQVRSALVRVAHGAAPSGPSLACLAGDRFENKYDWTLTPQLRSMDYASRHLNETGAREAASTLAGTIQQGRPPQ